MALWGWGGPRMGWLAPVAAAIARRRLDAALIGVLLGGSLGFDDGTVWLQPAASPAGGGKAFVVIAPHHHAGPNTSTDSPQLGYASTPLPGLPAGPRFTITANGPRDGGNLVGAAAPGGGLALGPGGGPHIAAALSNGLVFGNAPAQLNGGYSPGRSAPAVPEPSTWALIALGMAIVGGVGRWRAHRVSATPSGCPGS